MELKSRKPAFIAIKETEADLVDFEILEEDEEE
jgi:DNA-directed RNA polymerase subunit K/omega